MKRLGDWTVAHDTLVNRFFLVRKDPANGFVERTTTYPTKQMAAKACREKNKAMGIRQKKNRAALLRAKARKNRGKV